MDILVYIRMVKEQGGRSFVMTKTYIFDRYNCYLGVTDGCCAKGTRKTEIARNI